MLTSDRVRVGMYVFLLALIIAQLPSPALAWIQTCWKIVEGPIHEEGGCECRWATGHCGAYYQSYQINFCDITDGLGRLECTMPKRTVGYRWACNESTDWCGVIACWMLNALVCGLQCTAAVEGCSVCPGSWECIDALQSCYDCLVGEGVDCGCFLVYCEVGEVTHLIKANSAKLSGLLCNW